jgi:branched-chain amino acid transport system permease protein
MNMEIIIYGTINSLILLFMSAGFALAYSVSRVPNFTHGALYVLGGYLNWMLLNHFGVHYGLSILISTFSVAAFGWLIYQLFVIRVRGMQLSEILVTFAVALAILEFLRWHGLRGSTFVLPSFYSGTIDVFGVIVDYQRVFVMIAAIGIVIALHLFTHYTKIGLGLRAIAQNERAALLLGINSDRSAALALGLGSALAALAGITIFPLGNINVATGYDVLILAISVCICGGLGSWKGTVLAAFVLGFAQIAVVHFVAPQYGILVSLMAVILILIFKPSGLYGQQKDLEERV